MSKEFIGAAIELRQYLGSILPARLVTGRFITLRSLRLCGELFLFTVQSICVKWRDATPYLLQVRDNIQVLKKELVM